MAPYENSREGATGGVVTDHYTAGEPEGMPICPLCGKPWAMLNDCNSLPRGAPYDMEPDGNWFKMSKEERKRIVAEMSAYLNARKAEKK